MSDDTDLPILLLVDGYSYLYRAYHAMPDLRGPDDVPTGALHGMAAMMKRLRADVGAGHAACVFDAPGPTFRDEWYPDYKAHRPPMPDDLRRQIEPIHELVRLMGWPVVVAPGVEADDAIGTLARIGAAGGHRVVVSTGDKDLAQLVDERVTLINTMSNERLDVAGVQAKFGVPPDRIIDYLALVGDAVDNVPGVDKVGPKTAVKWLSEHGSLDGIVAAADSIKGVVGENLRRALGWLPLGRRLVTVRTDCDLAGQVQGWPSVEALALRPVDREGLLDFYTRYGFKAWRRELEAELGIGDGGAPASGAAAAALATPAAEALTPVPPELPLVREYETILDRERLAHWVERLRAAPLAALDTETDSLEPMRARVVGISFAVEPGRAAYVPLRHDYPGAPEQLPLDEVLATLRPWLEDAAAHKVGQNTKYDTHVLANHGIAVRGWQHDTLLQSYVVEAHLPHALSKLAERHLGRSGINYEDLCGKGAQQIPFSQVAIDQAATYSGEDSEMTLAVHQVLQPRIDAEPGFSRIYREIEMPVSALLARIERHGVLIDARLLAQQSGELARRMMELEARAHEIAGQPFNLGSPKQIGDILFGKLGLPVGKRTASGAPSTDEDVLQALAADFPLPATILEHR
ncbi:MAG: DNA polymerase, partial [Aquabacterium sp.]